MLCGKVISKETEIALRFELLISLKLFTATLPTFFCKLNCSSRAGYLECPEISQPICSTNVFHDAKWSNVSKECNLHTGLQGFFSYLTEIK